MSPYMVIWQLSKRQEGETVGENAKKKNFVLFYYSLCLCMICVHMHHQCTCMCMPEENYVLQFTFRWVLGIKFKSPGVCTSVFTHFKDSEKGTPLLCSKASIIYFPSNSKMYKILIMFLGSKIIVLILQLKSVYL